MATGNTNSRAPNSPASGSRNTGKAPHLLPTLHPDAIADRNSFPDSRDISRLIRSSSSTPHLHLPLNQRASRSSLRSFQNIDQERHSLYSLSNPHLLAASRTASPTASPAFTPTASANSSVVDIQIHEPDSPIEIRPPSDSCVNRRPSHSSLVQSPLAHTEGDHLLRPPSPRPGHLRPIDIRVIEPEIDAPVESGSSRPHTGRASPSSFISSQSQEDEERYSTHSLSAVSSPPSPTFDQDSSGSSSAIPAPLDGPFASANTSVADLQLMEFGDVMTPPDFVTIQKRFPDIFPGVPTSTSRYDRKVTIPDEPTRYTIPPLTIAVHANRPPQGWTVCQHPEGVQYFFHSEKRVFTDANIYKSRTLRFIENVMHRILSSLDDFLRSARVELRDIDLVLDECLCEDGTPGCRYYFVNHKDRCVFWMDEAPEYLFPIVWEIRGVTSAYHVSNILQAQYWYHCELYPRSLQVTPEILDELQDNASHGLSDLITSKTSTVSLKAEDLDQLLKLLHCRSAANTGDKKFDGTPRLVGRFMFLFTCDRVYNFHGVPGVRLDRNESVYGKPHKRTFLIKLLNPLLFLGPNLHLNNLRNICTDGLIHSREWPSFISRLNSEWQEFTTYSTILLNANVGFLSIQSVDQSGILRPDRSAAQIASYLSILISTGSILISLNLMRQNRDRGDAAAQDAAEFINRRKHAIFDLEPTAILYSLPYAMLIWSMVAFIAAFSLMWFQDSDTMTKAFVGVLGGVIAGLVFWCIFAVWDRDGSWWDWERLRRRLGLARATDDVADPIHTATDTIPSRRRQWKWLRSFLRPRPPDEDIELERNDSRV
ncbi:hypothetical protein FB45DRAFT_909787 [Roridomyces roridus]|uniref:WW domain-containing protein n=1 Tax=Roridomyces roridus TaxID=1738132 RepID=A0AAD7FR87_9AGAR|nr:hypothetical protein FB45DRAFT_909787 [Roridomyces roridus]